MHEGNVTATGKPTSSKRKSESKLALSANAPYQDILADDLKRSAKRKADEALCDIDLGSCRPKPPSVLHRGPISKKRLHGY